MMMLKPITLFGKFTSYYPLENEHRRLTGNLVSRNIIDINVQGSNKNFLKYSAKDESLCFKR